MATLVVGVVASQLVKIPFSHPSTIEWIVLAVSPQLVVDSSWW